MLPELQRPKQPRNKQPNEQAAKVQVLCLTGHLVYKEIKSKWKQNPPRKVNFLW